MGEADPSSNLTPGEQDVNSGIAGASDVLHGEDVAEAGTETVTSSDQQSVTPTE